MFTRVLSVQAQLDKLDEAPELIKPKRVCMAIPRSCEPLTQPGKVATIVSTGDINPS